MKTPTTSFLIRETDAGVSITIIQVLEVFPVTYMAYVGFGHGFAGRMHVPFAELASTPDKATAKIAEAMERLAQRMAREMNLTAASDEKSAAVPSLAGAGAA